MEGEGDRSGTSNEAAELSEGGVTGPEASEAGGLDGRGGGSRIALPKTWSKNSTSASWFGEELVAKA